MLIEKAKKIATHWHKDQKYGDFPYTVHLENVVNTTQLYLDDPVCEAVAWLHDILEDTDCPIEEIRAKMGWVIADAVQAISEPKSGTRFEKQTCAYYQIRQNPIALAVKLCDRLSNMDACIQAASDKCREKYKMYIKEYPGFKKALWSPNPIEAEALWLNLDHHYYIIERKQV